MIIYAQIYNSSHYLKKVGEFLLYIMLKNNYCSEDLFEFLCDFRVGEISERNSRMPLHSCCEMRVMQCMTYFFCASLQSCRRLYQMEDWLPPLILICYSPPAEVGVISHLIFKSFTRNNLYKKLRITLQHATDVLFFKWWRDQKNT